MFGFTAEEALGRNVSMLMPPEHAAAHDAHLKRYVTTLEKHIIGTGRVITGRRRDGTIFPMELQVGEVLTAGSHLFTGFVRDLTERQDRERRLAELQSELIHVSRLSDLGQMVSAIAHEVNQPLTAIANYIRGIRRLLTPENPPSLHEAIERVAAQAERAHRIVQGLRGLVKKEARPVQAENLETIVQETAALALSGTGRSVSLDLQIPPEAQDVEVDKVQIQQVLLNLIRNAVEAMAGTTASRLAVVAARCGERVEIRVTDNGPGLAPAVRDRLFQPFVTTKPEGLGVGLSICRAIVEAHGGELTAASPAGGGTCFSFTVPCSAAGATPTASPPADLHQ
jgi:two-component system sensor kinase FixL